jgi:glycosyltransferase involved in cell wall biosynthesis
MREGAGAPDAGSYRQTPQVASHAVSYVAYSKTIALVGPSGAALAVIGTSLIRDIIAHGHQVQCFASTFESTSARVLQGIGAQVAEIPPIYPGFAPFADRRVIKTLSSIFKQYRPDVVAGYTAKAAGLAGMAARHAGIEHRIAIIGELGPGFADPPAKPVRSSLKSQKSLLRFAFRMCGTAIFLNEENHKLLENESLLPDGLRQFPVNGTGIDLRQFPETPLPPFDQGVLFLFAGRLDKRFGVMEYCEAARLLKAKQGNYKFLLAGPEVQGLHGMSKKEMKRYRDAIHYLGPHTDLRPHIARAHAIVLPGTGDAIPRNLIEAIAMGRPVITSTARGCRVAVSEGQNGMLVAPGDPVALAGAMMRLLYRPDLLPSMARASRQFAETRFDHRKINGLLFSALDL